MNEERKLTLRNHLELLADELGEIEKKLESLFKDINAIQNEWIDDDALMGMCDVYEHVHDAAGRAWEVENLLEKSDFGKKRF